METQNLGPVNEMAYSALVQALKNTRKVNNLKAKADEAKDGLYNGCMSACVSITTLVEAKATLGAVEHAIQFNEDGLAVGCGAEKRDKPSTDGKKYKLPNSFTTVKSAIIFAFENGISLKNDKGEARTYGEIRDARTATVQAKKKEADVLLLATLTGVHLLRHQFGEILVQIGAQAQSWDEVTLTAAMAAIKPLARNPEQIKADKLHAANEAAKAREAAEKSEAKPTSKAQRRAARKAAQSGQSNQTVADDLSKAA